MRAKELDYIENTLHRINQRKNYEWAKEIEKLNLIDSIVFPVERLFSSYSSGFVMDFIGHLRQICVYYHGSIRVPENAFVWAKQNRLLFGLDVDIERSAVSAKPNVLQDIEDLQHSYSFVKKRHLEPSFPDPVIKNVFGFDSYISLQQKMMIHTMKKMHGGSTLLACLPTGSGKSLLWQYAMAMGKFKGTVLVIVPTNALGADHVKNDEIIMAHLPWVKSIAYSAESFGNDSDKMEHLCELIRNDEQLILYISPEGLTNAAIKKAVFDAASKQNLSAVVIDEAHLVVDWGMKFRPEYQFLPGLITQIKEKSNYTIYTVLLSATFTENDRTVLLNLFGDEDYYEYRGGELRPEISFYRHHCKSEKEREELIKRLIPVVPKPVIVYVGTIDQSEKYERIIKQSGFNRVSRFNGETKERERDRLITQWRNNAIDIMVATSAFGMGVDKPDVRTVITAYTPENISRYYQEVGRSGRDGYASLNFALFCPVEDSGVVRSNTDKKLISTDNLWKRWKALQDDAEVSSVPGETDCYTLNTDTKLKELTYEITGGYNSGWNDNVVSMLARAGYLSIRDVRRKGNTDSHKAYYIKVQINDVNICFKEEEYKKKIELFREKERKEIVEGKEAVKSLLEQDLYGCYANTFSLVFSLPSRLCGGCPICRKNGAVEYHETAKQSLITSVNMEFKKAFHYRNFASVCTDSCSVTMIGYEKKLSDADYIRLIKKLMIAEVNIIVLENWDRLKSSDFDKNDNKEVLILSIDEISMVPKKFICGNIAFFFGEKEETNRKMLEYAKKNILRNKNINPIFVADLEYYDQDEKRMLIDCVENVKMANIILGEEDIC